MQVADDGLKVEAVEVSTPIETVKLVMAKLESLFQDVMGTLLA